MVPEDPEERRVHTEAVRDGIKSCMSNKLFLRQNHFRAMLGWLLEAATQVQPASFDCQIYIGTVSPV